MSETHHAHPTPRTLGAEIRKATSKNPARCYQCGKCSAGCPMASEMKLKTHEVIRYIQNDDRRKLYDDDSIWLCVACETCTARCPNEVDPARMLDSLREIVLRDNPSQAPRAIQSFHEAFLGQVRSHGRLFEFGLVASYKMRTGKLFEDVLATPGMISRGKLAFVPTRIRGAADVRRIMDEAIALSKEEAK